MKRIRNKLKKTYEVLLTGKEYKPNNISFYERRRREWILRKFNVQPGGMDAGMPGDMDYFLIERKFSALNPPGWMDFYFKISNDTGGIPILIEIEYQSGKQHFRISAPIELLWDGQTIAKFGEEPVEKQKHIQKIKFYNPLPKIHPKPEYYKIAFFSNKINAKNGLHVLRIRDNFNFDPYPIGINHAVVNLLAPYILIDAIRITCDRPIKLIRIKERYDEVAKSKPKPLFPIPESKDILNIHSWWRSDYKTDLSFLNKKAVTSGHPLDNLCCWPTYNHPFSGVSYMLVQNNSNKEVKVENILINGVPVKKLLECGYIYWYRTTPEIIPRGKSAEVAVRFRKVPKSHIMEVRLNDGTAIKGKIHIEQSPYRITAIITDRKIEETYIYVEGKEFFTPDKVLLNGTDVRTKARVYKISELNGMKKTYIKTPLPTRLARGDYLDVVLVKGSKKLAGRIKVWNSRFIIGAWTGIGYNRIEYEKKYKFPGLPLNTVWHACGDWSVTPEMVTMIEEDEILNVITGHGCLGYFVREQENKVRELISMLQAKKSPFAMVHVDEINNQDILTYGEPGYYAQLVSENHTHWEKYFPYALTSTIFGYTSSLDIALIYGQLFDLPNYDCYLQLDPRSDVFEYKSYCETIRAASMPKPTLIMLGTERFNFRKKPLKTQPQCVLDRVRFEIFLCTASGIKGVTFFAMVPNNPHYGTVPFWEEIARTTDILNRINRILNKSQPVDLSFSNDDRVFVKTLLCGEEGILLFLFNMDYINPKPEELTDTELDQPKWNYPPLGKKIKVKVSVPSWMKIEKVYMIQLSEDKPVDFENKNGYIELSVDYPRVSEIIYIKSE